MMRDNIHATCVALPPEPHGTGDTVNNLPPAILLTGPSGIGKSDLALRLIMHHGHALVADDRTDIETIPDGAQIVASCPPPLEGKIEVRGIGIITLDHQHRVAKAAPLLIVELQPSSQIARLPDPLFTPRKLLTMDVPSISLAPQEASAPLKLQLAIARLRGSGQ